MPTNVEPWGNAEKSAWLQRQKVQRSYANDVLQRINALPEKHFSKVQYGVLSFAPARYPLYAIKALPWRPQVPLVLVTGGVHGYETSGVKGALQFLESESGKYASRVNLLVAPCISPWSYETINRWNPQTENPNREFKVGGTSEES